MRLNVVFSLNVWILSLLFLAAWSAQSQNDSVPWENSLTFRLGQTLLSANLSVKACRLQMEGSAGPLVLTDLIHSYPVKKQVSINGKSFPGIFFADPDMDLIFSDGNNARLTLRRLKELYKSCWEEHFLKIHGSAQDLLEPLESASVTGSWPVRLPDEGSFAALLKKGKRSLISRHRLIRDARRSIWYKTFEFYGDESGQSLAEALISRKKKDNLDIRLFIDAFPLWLESDKHLVRNSRIVFNNLMAAGIPVYGYSCGDSQQIYHELRKDFWHAGYLNHRFHEKALIVDAASQDGQAIIGGINSTNQYFRIGLEKWSDVDLLFGGSAVRDAGTSFLADWDSYGRNNGADFSCLNAAVPGTEAYEIFFREHYQPLRIPSTEKERLNQLVSGAELASLKQGLIDGKVFRQRPHSASLKFIKNDPRKGQEKENNAIEKSLIQILDQARQEVIISNIYFIPSEVLIKALRRAVLRGVNLLILTNSHESNSQQTNVRLSRFYYETIKYPYRKHAGIKRMFKHLFSANYRKHRKEWLRAFPEQTGRVEFFEFYGDKEDTVEVTVESFEEGSGDSEEGFQIHLKEPVKKTIHNIVRGHRTGITLLHSKYFIIDRHLVGVGSYNIDPRSRNLSREHILWADSTPLAYELLTTFFQDVALSKRVDDQSMHSYRHPRSGKKSFDLLLSRSLESQF